MTGFVVELPCELSSPAEARHALAAELVAHGVCLDRPGVESAMLIVSELVTNAIVHGSSPIRLTVDIDHSGIGPAVTVSVSDASSALPMADAKPVAGQVGGWGLELVDQVSLSWGVLPPHDDELGKVVWARLDL
jgi:anti-sigma regulatory factor (Ser/Thr protein kinase)